MSPSTPIENGFKVFLVVNSKIHFQSTKAIIVTRIIAMAGHYAPYPMKHFHQIQVYCLDYVLGFFCCLLFEKQVKIQNHEDKAQSFCWSRVIGQFWVAFVPITTLVPKFYFSIVLQWFILSLHELLRLRRLIDFRTGGYSINWSLILPSKHFHGNEQIFYES